MKLQIDNLDGSGLRDYSGNVDASSLPKLFRRLNRPAELHVSLVATGPDFIVPAAGARVVFGMNVRPISGQERFTGYLMQEPTYEYLGWGERGPIYRYVFVAFGDEALLDEKRLPERPPFVERSAGSALRQLTDDLLPGVFDASAVQDLDKLVGYASTTQKTWLQQAEEIATQARACYWVLNGALSFAPIGSNVYPLNESDASFNAAGLKLQPVNKVINDIIVIGENEPQAYVKDYFVGDGLTTRFYLSQTPFSKGTTTVFDEEYSNTTLEPTLWSTVDPAEAIAVSGGKLQVAGGTGSDGGTIVQFVEPVELGGALVMQHGDVMFSAPSSGVLGGLYTGAVSLNNCLAGFRITPNGSQSNIQAAINGMPTGSPLTTIATHHYLLTTRLYSLEIYRRQQVFHSSLHPAGSGVGGAALPADVRIVLEVHDIDPANPGSEVAPSTVLYDGVFDAAPEFCTYALVNAANMKCNIAFTRMLKAPDAEVRSALPGQSYRTRLVGPLSTGAECNVTSNAEVGFYSSYVPAANELIEVRYRDSGRAMARVIDSQSIAAQRRGVDDGVHGAVRHIKLPQARTTEDCENAALALLDDGIGPAWAGEYAIWSDFLPGDAPDIFPGDAFQINVPSRGANFPVIVREVGISLKDLQGDHCIYTIKFANEAAELLAFEFDAAQLSVSLDPPELTNTQIGQTYLEDLTEAEVTEVDSTSISIDVGPAPLNGGGFEVRWSDAGWGPDNDRNLVGRFTSESFTIPRLSRVQDCYLRQYDASNPPKYSRFSTALHVDYPL